MAENNQSQLAVQTPASDQESDGTIQRLIRLTVGLILVGQDALRKQLPLWEAEAARLLAERADDAKDYPSSPPAQTEEADTVTAEDTPWFPISWEQRLVGFAFESPNYLRSALSSLAATNRQIWRKTAPLRLPLDLLGISDLTGRWADSFIKRLKMDMEHFEEIGAKEADASRAVASIAVANTYDALLQSLAKNPEVQDLIQQQSIGLTSTFVEEVRERTVGGDLLTDRIARRLLRLRPTEPAPQQIRQAAKAVDIVKPPKKKK